MYQADTRRRILSYERQYRTWAERMAELRLQEDLHILKDAEVVGMTTTGRKVGGIYLLKPSLLSGAHLLTRGPHPLIQWLLQPPMSRRA